MNRSTLPVVGIRKLIVGFQCRGLTMRSYLDVHKAILALVETNQIAPATAVVLFDEAFSVFSGDKPVFMTNAEKEDYLAEGEANSWPDCWEAE